MWYTHKNTYSYSEQIGSLTRFSRRINRMKRTGVKIDSRCIYSVNQNSIYRCTEHINSRYNFTEHINSPYNFTEHINSSYNFTEQVDRQCRCGEYIYVASVCECICVAYVLCAICTFNMYIYLFNFVSFF